MHITINPSDIDVAGWSNIPIAKIPADYAPNTNVLKNYVDSGGNVFKFSMVRNGEIAMQILSGGINKINFLFINECYI